jgi:hypothetical protein
MGRNPESPNAACMDQKEEDEFIKIAGVKISASINLYSRCYASFPSETKNRYRLTELQFQYRRGKRQDFNMNLRWICGLMVLQRVSSEHK